MMRTVKMSSTTGKTTTATPRRRRTTKSEHAAIATTMDPMPGLVKTVPQWAEEFRASRERTVAAIVDLGKLLIEGKAAMAHGQWQIALELAGIDVREAEKCIRIANHAVLANPSNFTLLPDARSTLYELSGLQPEVVSDLIGAGVVNPRVTCKELKVAVAGTASEPRKWSAPRPITDAVATFFGGSGIDHVEDGAGFTWRRDDETVTLLPAATTGNRFHNLIRNGIACFALGKQGVPERALVVFYLGSRRDEFVAAFSWLGVVVEAIGA
jgi:hypothetical protein